MNRRQLGTLTLTVPTRTARATLCPTSCGPGDRGLVEVGQWASLLLLDADPRDDIRHTRAISAVIHDGRPTERAELDTIMSDLDALHTPVRAWFSPRASEILAGR